MNKESKRLIYVDGAKTYDAKSNVTNWYIQLRMGLNEDCIRIYQYMKLIQDCLIIHCQLMKNHLKNCMYNGRSCNIR